MALRRAVVGGLRSSANVVRLIRIDPPGTHCHYAALWDLLRHTKARTFLEVGVGSGRLAALLLSRGLRGYGIDASQEAIALAQSELRHEIADGRIRLLCGDIFDTHPTTFERVDLALSMMVMEHVEDDVGFVRSITRFIRPGGQLIISVPARRDLWSIEDETVGHVRRYDRADLERTLRTAGLTDIVIHSVAVPVANMLYRLGNLMIKRSTERRKTQWDKREQTHHSGIREVPFKTVFPKWFRLILNPVVLYPFFVMQRLFYQTNLGLEIMALARVPADQSQSPVTGPAKS
jgi:2-polyprenyl-3-methyl-5-hydroxy-6-metoxy-1,4-benzoquinol methylase